MLLIDSVNSYADVAELADALDLGSSVPDVKVQVLSSALIGNSYCFRFFFVKVGF